LRVCHGQTLETLEKILLTFKPAWLKSTLTKFEAGNIKSVGGVRSNASRGKRQNGTNLHVQFKMADFLWPRRHDVKRRFCVPGHDEGVYRVSSGYGEMTPFVWRNYNVVGGATEPFCAANVRERQIAPFPPTTGVPAKIGVVWRRFRKQ